MKCACMLLSIACFLILLSMVAAETEQIEIKLLKNSWNAIGVPYEEFILDESDCKGKYYRNVYYWDPYDGKFKYIDSLSKIKGGVGYFVYAKEDCTLKIRGWKWFAIDSLSFHAGWNFISGLKVGSRTATKEDLETKCIVEKIYYFNSTQNKWQVASNLEEGKGYWVKCSKLTLEDCVLDESNWEITCKTTCRQAKGKLTMVTVLDKEGNVAIAYEADKKRGSLTISEGKIVFSTKPSLSMLEKDKSKWKVILVCSQPIGDVSEVGVK